jgi:hypothetical protein
MIDWQEVERNRAIELAAAYNRLLELVTAKYRELECSDPKLAKLAKAMAKNHHPIDMFNDLYYSVPAPLPISVVDGKNYTCVSFSVTQFVPLWALYLPRAIESIELMKKVDAE